MSLSSATIESEPDALARSLWTATANPRPDTPPLTGDAETTVAVIGGGFAGLSAALHLAQRGIAVTLLEAKHPGWGASGRNGGQVIPGLKEDPDAVEAFYGSAAGGRAATLSGDAPSLVFDLIERYGIACGAVRNGWIQPRHDEASAGLQRTRAEAWRRRGVDVELLDADEIAARLGSEGYVGGMADPRGGSLQPLNYALGLAHAAIGEGARIHGHSPVEDMTRQDDRWRLVTPGGTLTAANVLVATNAYSGDLTGALKRSVVPACSVQVATEPLSDNIRRSILPGGEVASDTRRLLLYYRLDPEGRFIIGGRGAYSSSGVVKQQARLRAAALHLFPQLGERDWPFHWGGMVALTTDHLPHLHRLGPGLYAGLGFNGRGVAMATAMGRVLADKAAGAPDEDLDFPVTTLKPIPFHAIRKQVVGAISGYYAVRDRLAAP